MFWLTGKGSLNILKTKIYKKYAKKTTTELEGQQFKKGLKWDGKAIAEKIPTLNSFSSARNKGKRPQVLY